MVLTPKRTMVCTFLVLPSYKEKSNTKHISANHSTLPLMKTVRYISLKTCMAILLITARGSADSNSLSDNRQLIV